MTRALLLPLLVVSLCSSLVTLMLGLMVAPWVFTPSSHAAPVSQASVPVVRAERIELVDATGVVRARLAVADDTGAVELVLLDPDGRGRATLAASSDGDAHLALVGVGPRGSAARLVSSPGDGARLRLDGAGLNSADLHVQPDGRVDWHLTSLSGGIGAGSIDASVVPPGDGAPAGDTRFNAGSIWLSTPWVPEQPPSVRVGGLDAVATLRPTSLQLDECQGLVCTRVPNPRRLDLAPDRIILREGGEANNPSTGRPVWQAPSATP